MSVFVFCFSWTKGKRGREEENNKIKRTIETFTRIVSLVCVCVCALCMRLFASTSSVKTEVACINIPRSNIWIEKRGKKKKRKYHTWHYHHMLNVLSLNLSLSLSHTISALVQPCTWSNVLLLHLPLVVFLLVPLCRHSSAFSSKRTWALGNYYYDFVCATAKLTANILFTQWRRFIVFAFSDRLKNVDGIRHRLLAYGLSTTADREEVSEWATSTRRCLRFNVEFFFHFFCSNINRSPDIWHWLECADVSLPSTANFVFSWQFATRYTETNRLIGICKWKTSAYTDNTYSDWYLVEYRIWKVTSNGDAEQIKSIRRTK